MTKLGERRVHTVRGHGGIVKFKALKLDHGNYSWPGEAISRKTRIIGVVYNPTNAEFVRTNTIVKGSIIQIDATPFKNWYQKHYGVLVGKEVPFEKPKKVKKLKRGEKPKKGKKTTEKKGEKKETEKKGTEKKGADKKGTEKKGAEKKGTEKKGTEKKGTDKKGAEKKGTEKKGTEKKGTTAEKKPTEKKPTEKKTTEKKPTTTEKPTEGKPEKKGKGKKRPPSAKHSPSSAMKKKWRLRNATRALEPAISEQFDKGRLYAKITTSPGQTGTADGYILEGEELAFYTKKMALKKKK